MRFKLEKCAKAFYPSIFERAEVLKSLYLKSVAAIQKEETYGINQQDKRFKTKISVSLSNGRIANQFECFQMNSVFHVNAFERNRPEKGAIVAVTVGKTLLSQFEDDLHLSDKKAVVKSDDPESCYTLCIRDLDTLNFVMVVWF